MALATAVYREMGLHGLYREMVATVENVGFLSFIIAGAFCFSYVATVEGISTGIAAAVVSLAPNPYVLLLLLSLWFLLGLPSRYHDPDAGRHSHDPARRQGAGD
jgi:TRAP-type C4-dicarboxylate transport system permease large subunit